MSVADDVDARERTELEDWPAFELSYLFDDREEPTEVTVFPDGDRHDISTNWITADADAVVALEEAR